MKAFDIEERESQDIFWRAWPQFPDTKVKFCRISSKEMRAMFKSCEKIEFDKDHQKVKTYDTDKLLRKMVGKIILDWEKMIGKTIVNFTDEIYDLLKSEIGDKISGVLSVGAETTKGILKRKLVNARFTSNEIDLIIEMADKRIEYKDFNYENFKEVCDISPDFNGFIDSIIKDLEESCYNYYDYEIAEKEELVKN